MSRRPAQITQADVARVIRAAKQAGAAEVIIPIGDQAVVVRFQPSAAPAPGAAPPVAPAENFSL